MRGSGTNQLASCPRMTAALSRYADNTAPGLHACVCRIISNRERSCLAPPIVQVALKILWRQCSEFTCANIISSASVGSRPNSRSRSRRWSISAEVKARPREAFASSRAPRGSAPSGIVEWEGGVPSRKIAFSPAPGPASFEKNAPAGNAHWVMRSWSRPEPASDRRILQGSPPEWAIDHATPRSMRDTLSRPQWRAMSVALLDHGEIVPGRGATTIVPASIACARSSGIGEASRSRSSRSTIHSETPPAPAK